MDLNPLHDVISQRNYKEKYYKGLMPLGVKYAEVISMLSTGKLSINPDFFTYLYLFQNLFLKLWHFDSKQISCSFYPGEESLQASL